MSAPRPLLPLVPLQLVHLDEEGVWGVVQLLVEAVAERVQHADVAPDLLHVLGPDLDQRLLLVAVLGGGHLGLLKPVACNLLQVNLLKMTRLVRQVDIVLRHLPLRHGLLLSATLLLVTVLSVSFLLEVFLLVLVLVVLDYADLELDAAPRPLLLHLHLLSLLGVDHGLVTAVILPRETGDIVTGPWKI